MPQGPDNLLTFLKWWSIVKNQTCQAVHSLLKVIKKSWQEKQNMGLEQCIWCYIVRRIQALTENLATKGLGVATKQKDSKSSPKSYDPSTMDIFDLSHMWT